MGQELDVVKVLVKELVKELDTKKFKSI